MAHPPGWQYGDKQGLSLAIGGRGNTCNFFVLLGSSKVRTRCPSILLHYAITLESSVYANTFKIMATLSILSI